MGGEHVNVRLVVCEFYQRTGNFSVGTREYTSMQDTCNTLEGHFSARNPTKLGVTNHTNEASTGFHRAFFFLFFSLSLPWRAGAAGSVSCAGVSSGTRARLRVAAKSLKPSAGCLPCECNVSIPVQTHTHTHTNAGGAWETQPYPIRAPYGLSSPCR